MKNVFKIGAMCFALLLLFCLAACGKKHTHTFENTYSHNETHHWMASTCGHEEKSAYDAHAYGEGVTFGIGGKLFTCSVCGYQRIENATI